MFYEYAINLPLNRLNAFYDLLEKIKKEQKQKNISDKELMEMKLIDDMFDFSTQIRFSIDKAVAPAELLTGKTSPKTTNKYETIDEYQAETKEVIKFLEELKEEDFINKNAEYSSLYFEQWKKLVWKNIFYFFLPNMFFHMTTAYDIVRHFGFDVGKADFLWRATFDLFE